MPILDPKDWGRVPVAQAEPLMVRWNLPQPAVEQPAVMQVAPAVRAEAFRPLSERGAVAGIGVSYEGDDEPAKRVTTVPQRAVDAVTKTMGRDIAGRTSAVSLPPTTVTGNLPEAADTDVNMSVMPAKVTPTAPNMSVPATTYQVEKSAPPQSAASEPLKAKDVQMDTTPDVQVIDISNQQAVEGKLGTTSSRTQSPMDWAQLKKLGVQSRVVEDAMQQRMNDPNLRAQYDAPWFDVQGAEKARDIAREYAVNHGATLEQAEQAGEDAAQSVYLDTFEMRHHEIPSINDEKLRAAEDLRDESEGVEAERRSYERGAELSARGREAQQETLAAKAAAPTDYKRVQRERGTVGNVLAVLAQAMGAFGSALTHTPNYAKQILDEAVERDIREQDQARAQANQDLSNARHNTADAERHVADQRADFQARKVSLLEKAKLRLNALDAKLLPADEQVRYENMKLAVEDALTEARRKQFAGQSTTTAVQTGVRERGANLDGLIDPDLVYKDEAGNTYAHTKGEHAQEIRKEKADADEIIDASKELIDLSAKASRLNIPNEELSKYEARAGTLRQLIAKQVHGRVTEATLEMLNNDVIRPNNLRNPNNVAALEQVIADTRAHYGSIVKAAPGRRRAQEVWIKLPNGALVQKYRLTGEDMPGKVTSSAIPAAGGQ